MDRMSRAVYRLWGSLGEDGKLHASPRFADELAARYEGDLALRDTSISKWSFGQQLEHLYMATHYVLDRLHEAMTAAETQDHPSLWGHAFVAGGYIPRGLFPTIPQLIPGGGTREEIQPLKESLHVRLEQLAWNLDQINANPGRSPHPRMKYLLARQWLFFLDVHHRHHLRIMRDILKATRTGRGRVETDRTRSVGQHHAP